jgi:N-acetylmuramoyl-L-alanine amidase
LCAAALLRGSSTAQAQVYQGPAPQAAIPSPAGVSNFPIASDARLAGDAKQTRFILDLDKAVQFRAFALADPYRVIVDLPQVSFQLPAGAGVAGRIGQGVPLRSCDAGRIADRV